MERCDSTTTSTSCSRRRANEVRFLVVGGYAVALHGHPRYTGDLDVWVRIDAANTARLLKALEEFGLGSVGLVPEDFLRAERVVQLGDPPLRVDLLTTLDGVDFDECWGGRVEVELDGLEVPFIGRADLLRNKRACGCPQDLAASTRWGPRDDGRQPPCTGREVDVPGRPRGEAHRRC